MKTKGDTLFLPLENEVETLYNFFLSLNRLFKRQDIILINFQKKLKLAEQGNIAFFFKFKTNPSAILKK
jgi:hypothetical protein